MLKRFPLRRIVVLIAASSAFGLNTSSFAAAFSLWEQDAASIGNYHAGTAATADDASTAWYNPAGLVRIPNQQLVVGADPILTNFRYNGTVWVSTIFGADGMDPNPAPPHAATAQGGGFNLVPFLHYAAPISDRVVFGMSIDVPFGLKTDYGNDTYVRYAATLTQLQVIDYTPSLGVKITDKFSVGAGVDFQRLQAELNQIATMGTEGEPFLDTRSHNSASDWGYGWRIGALYQFTPHTRLGINYRSKVSHHAKGRSSFIGPLATNDKQYSSNFFANATLPAITSMSLFHSLNPCWDVMGSVTYTQWNVFQNLILQNVAGINMEGLNSNNVVVDVVNKYRIVWSYSGVRCLQAERKRKFSQITRDYKLILNSALLTVVGGKLTTHRVLAEKALDLLKQCFPHMKDAWTDKSYLPGCQFPNDDFEEFSRQFCEKFSWLPPHLAKRYTETYGTRAYELLDSCTQIPDLGMSFSKDLFQREVEFLISNEWARTADDILWRRTKLGLTMSDNEKSALVKWIDRFSK